MGLDMNPTGKPLQGKEKRFEYLFEVIYRDKKQHITLVDRILGKKPQSIDELYEEFLKIQISSYEVVKAPMVGRDQAANEWLKTEHIKRGVDMPFDKFIEENSGYYVLELAEDKDALAEYNNLFSEDAIVFRGQFICDCEDLIGKNMVSEAWESKLPAETLDYGNRLLKVADKIAQENKMTHVKDMSISLVSEDETSIEYKLHIIYRLAKWLIFYGNKGCGYIADY